MTSILQRINGLVSEKRRWRAYKTRTATLPTSYRTAIDGLERYLLNTGPSDGTGLMRMLDDLADLFERAALDATPIAELVGADPVEFAEEFKASYGLSGWIAREQQRLTEAVQRAEREEGIR